MKFAFAFFAVLLCAAVPARAQIERPRLGFVLDSRGALRPVMGAPASATLGDPAGGDPAISFACSSKLCLEKTDAAVSALVPGDPNGGRGVAMSHPIAAAPCAPCPGPALIALDDFGVDTPGAWIYFQAAHRLARWHNGVLDTADFAHNGQVLSLRATAGGFDYAIVRESHGRKALRPRATVVWIEHYSASDGGITIVDSLGIIDTSGAAPAVMLLDGGILLSSRDHVVLRRPDGSEMTFPLVGPMEFHAAGNGYVEIAVPDGLWILRTDPGREQLFLLPGAAEQ